MAAGHLGGVMLCSTPARTRAKGDPSVHYLVPKDLLCKLLQYVREPGGNGVVDPCSVARHAVAVVGICLCFCLKVFVGCALGIASMQSTRAYMQSLSQPLCLLHDMGDMGQRGNYRYIPHEELLVALNPQAGKFIIKLH